MNKNYDKIREANQKNWDSRVPIHVKSKEIYNLGEFKKGKASFVANEDQELLSQIDLKGKSLLHLQCHFGIDTMSFSRMGVDATGVDFSPVAISTARELCKELGLSTKFIESDIYDLPDKLQEKFDVVFTSCGVLTWLPDLGKWAEIVEHFLKPGGLFYLKESHPIQHIFDYEAEVPDKFKPFHPYFKFGEALEYHEPFTYAHDGTAELVDQTLNYQFDHRLETIFNAIINASLKIVKIQESPLGFYQAFKFLEHDIDGGWVFPEGYKGVIPLTITIFATK